MLTSKCNNRGCGTRSKGGVYLCVGKSPFGRKIESFIEDPPKMVPGEIWTSRAPKLIPRRSGVNDVYMKVSPNDYKCFWDFVEESRNFGISRKVSPNFPFKELTPGESKLRLVFPYGVPKFAYDCQEWEHDDWWEKWCSVWKSGKVNSEWETMGNHPVYMPEKHKEWREILKYRKMKIFYRFCTFAHRDMATWFHYEDRQLDHDTNTGSYFIISFPTKNPQFDYIASELTLFGDDNRETALLRMFLNKENWYPAILFSIPISHVEIPYEDDKDIADVIRASGYQTEVVDW